MSSISAAVPATRVSIGRWAFWLFCAWGVATMWLSPHLPQVDLPQHAGQVALLRDLLAGASPWQDVLRINLLTPYLIGYLSLYGLSLVMPIAAGIALLYSVAFVGFVSAGVSLRRQVGADERLDWLFLPVFFGLSWRWGFFTFLLAMPIGLWLVREAYRLVDTLQRRHALAVLALGVLLLFAHGLVFLWAVPLAGLIALASTQRPLRQRLWVASVPLLLLVLFVLYKKLVIDGEMNSAVGSEVLYFGPLWGRLYAFIAYPVAGTAREFLAAPAVVAALFAAPWLLGLRVQPGLARKVPFLCTVGMMVVLPSFVYGATHFFERFAMLLPVTYALLFGAAPGVSRLPAWRAVAGLAALALAAGAVFVRETTQNLAFAAESRAADQALAELPPQRRVLWVPAHRASDTTRLRDVFLHYPLWYQAQRGGLVEFNFATLLPQVVRFRELKGHVSPVFGWKADEFVWTDHAAQGYDYVVLRSATPPAAPMLENTTCPLQPVVQQSGWYVYKGACGR